MKSCITCSLSLALIGLSVHANADLLLTSDYDSTTTNANQIDVSATSDGGNELSFTTFETLVEAGFAAQTSGVATFDQTGDVITASTGSMRFADNSVLATLTRTGNTEIQSGGGGRTPISGTRGVGGSNSYGFDFNEADQIIAVGLTILSRSGNGSGDTTITATFVDSDGNNSETISQSSFMSDSNGGDDTFFGFAAPTGKFLDGITVTTPYFTYLDDLGVVTLVPEPGSMGLVAIGATMIFARRRR